MNSGTNRGTGTPGRMSLAVWPGCSDSARFPWGPGRGTASSRSGPRSPLGNSWTSWGTAWCYGVEETGCSAVESWAERTGRRTGANLLCCWWWTWNWKCRASSWGSFAGAEYSVRAACSARAAAKPPGFEFSAGERGSQFVSAVEHFGSVSV